MSERLLYAGPLHPPPRRPQVIEIALACLLGFLTQKLFKLGLALLGMMLGALASTLIWQLLSDWQTFVEKVKPDARRAVHIGLLVVFGLIGAILGPRKWV